MLIPATISIIAILHDKVKINDIVSQCNISSIKVSLLTKPLHKKETGDQDELTYLYQ